MHEKLNNLCINNDNNNNNLKCSKCNITLRGYPDIKFSNNDVVCGNCENKDMTSTINNNTTSKYDFSENNHNNNSTENNHINIISNDNDNH